MAKTDRKFIQLELKEIQKQISALNKKKFQLENKLIKGASTLDEKFLLWSKSDVDTEPHDWIPSEEKFPILRKIIYGMKFNRKEHVDILDYFQDDFYLAFELTSSEVEELEEFDKKVREKYRMLGKEIMKGKLKSFKYDW